MKVVMLEREGFPSDLDSKLSLNVCLGGLHRPLASMGRASVVDVIDILMCLRRVLRGASERTHHFDVYSEMDKLVVHRA